MPDNSISKIAEADAKPSKFNLEEWFKQHLSLFTFLGTVVTLLALFWAIHTEISGLHAKVGVVEGKMEMFLLDQRSIWPNKTNEINPAP